MRTQQYAGEDESFLRRYEYDDAWVVAADLGVSDESVDVDIVGETAIVVVEAGSDVREREFDLPGPDGEVEVNNGVLTITVGK